MQDFVPTILPRLESHRLPGLDAGSQALYPSYEDYSLVNLPTSMCYWLGVPEFGAPPLGKEVLNTWAQGEFDHVIFFVIDGFGLNGIQAALKNIPYDRTLQIWSELAENGVLAPITSISPSTTAAALTTLWTGRPPSEHGVVAYEVWLKEYSLIANMISHNPTSFKGDVGSLTRAGFDPRTFLPVPTLGPHLLNHGVKAYAYQHQSIAFSGLSTMLFPGVEVMPFRNLGDLWVTLANQMEEKPRERNYTYIYWGDLDELSHRFGPQDERVRRELAGLSLQMAAFVKQMQASRSKRGKTLFIITADHGHIYNPRNPEYEIRNHPQLLDCMVMLPSGEARLPFVYLRPGKEKAFLDYIQDTWQDRFKAIPSAQVMQAGLFGEKISERFPDRIGDYLIVPQTEEAYWWFAPNRDNPLLGRHGGLSHTEMLSPFFASVL